MTDVKFSDFTDGTELKIGDIVVGLRGGVNYKFDFPSDGFKDGNGNYLIQYATAGAVAVNYIKFTNANAAAGVTISSDGTDTDIDINVNPKGTGLWVLQSTTGVDAVLDEDTMVSDSATALATQQSIKAYVDNNTIPLPSGSTGEVLRYDGADWVASTSTFADTYSASTLLYSNGANTVEGLATANSAMLYTSATGVPAWSASLTDGQVMIGTTGGSPSPSTLTPGTGIAIANVAGGITISATGGGFAVATISGTTQSAAVNTMYIALNAGQTTVTLPVTFSVGDTVSVVGSGANAAGWIITAGAGDTVMYNGTATSGGGTLTSSALAGQTIEMVADVADTSWVVVDTVNTTLTTA